MKKKNIIFSIIFLLFVIFVFAIFLKKKRGNHPDIKIPGLLYHNFVTTVPDSDSDNYQYINTPKSFEENIRTLQKSGYTFLSFHELNDTYQNKTKLPKKPILITFDDGYQSNYEYIYPILKKYHIKASIFIVLIK